LNFLYPNFLWFLSLASVPVILHLLSRIRLKRVEFSALYFLKDVKRERFSWLRLKEILLLIFRTLLIIFIFLALARPKFQGKLLPVKRQASFAIIIDDSYSMGYAHHFTSAKSEAKRIVSQLNSGSEVLVLISTSSEPIYQGRNMKLATQAVDSLTVSYAGADLAKSMFRAQTELEKSGITNKEIYIISDLQKRSFITILSGFKPKFPVYVIDVGNGQKNCAINQIVLSERFPNSARPTKIGAKIKNYGKEEVYQKVVLKFGEKIEEQRLKLTEGEERTILFETEIGNSGQYSGSIKIEPDSLEVDDERYFSFVIPEKIRILLIYSEPNDIFYLTRALLPESLNTFDVEVVVEKEFRQKNLANFTAIGVINPNNFTRADWQRLEYFEQRGGKVFIALDGEPKDKSGLERFFDFELLMKPTGFVTIDRFKTDHPIFEVFSGIDLSNAQFFQWAKVKPKDVKVLASFTDGSPFILESNNQKYLMATANFNLAATDLVFKPIFLPLMQRVFFYLAQGDIRTEYEVGSTVSAKVQSPGLVKIKTPKEEYSVMPEIIGEEKFVTIQAIKDPGMYWIGEKFFVVNIDVAESDLNRVKEEELVRAGFKLTEENPARATDLTGLFLYLAFLALAIEMVFLLI
jgi:hypothetical protein